MKELIEQFLSIPATVWYNAPNIPAWAIDKEEVIARILEKQQEVIEKIKLLTT